MQNRLDAAREARAASERQLAEVQAAIAAERAARPESVRFQVYIASLPGFSLVLYFDFVCPRGARNEQDQRAAALARLAATTKELAELQTELDAYGACDPVKVEEKRRAAVLAREAALRHTGLGLCIRPPTNPRLHSR
jgi:hypothetical protein